MQAVLVAGQERETQGIYRIAGLTLLERNVKLLEACGVCEVVIVAPAGTGLPRALPPGKIPIRHQQVANVYHPLQAMASIRTLLRGPFLFLLADLLIDPRILGLLAKQQPPCLVVSGGGLWQLGILEPQNLSTARTALEQKATRLLPCLLDPYHPELRGTVMPYVEKIDSREKIPVAWNILLDGATKRPADLVEKYLDPPIENLLVRWLCQTPVTPNQITLFSFLTAAGATYLFFHGSMLFGLLLAWITVILDGVDGKLARIKLQTSPVGKFEHVGDFFYENSWYLAIAWAASRSHPSAWPIGLAIVVLDLMDNVNTALFSLHTGKTLDEMSGWDRAFRLIGGRRTIYLPLLFAGSLLARPLAALWAVMVWAGVTVAVHCTRMATHLLSSRGKLHGVPQDLQAKKSG